MQTTSHCYFYLHLNQRGKQKKEIFHFIISESTGNVGKWDYFNEFLH